MSLTKLSLARNCIKVFPARESLVSDFPAGDGKTENLFLQSSVTVPYISPLPNMMDFSARVARCNFFSSQKYIYYQTSMHPADIPNTAIITPFGLFKFLRLTFGLMNAGITFQRRMDH
jgi:hypothetical protein